MINLIPPQLLVRREKNLEIRRWLMRLSLLAICCAGLFFGSLQIISGTIVAVEKTKAEYNQKLNILTESSDLLSRRDLLWKRWETIAAIHTPRTSAWHLELLSRALPNDCYVRSLDLVLPVAIDDTGATETSPGWMRLSGSAQNHGQVSMVIHSLSRSNAFADVNLVSISDPGGTGGAGEILFEMNCVTKHTLDSH